MLRTKLGLSLVAVCALHVAVGCGDDDGVVTPNEEESEDASTPPHEQTSDEGPVAVDAGDDEPTETPSTLDGGGDEPSFDGGPVVSADAGAPTEGDTSEPDEKPLYLMTVGVAGDGDNGSLYLIVRDKVDFNFSIEDLKEEGAREFEPYSGVAAIDGHVIIGKSNAPVAQKFSVSDEGEFKQVGDDLHFGDYFSGDADGLNFYFQAIKGTDMFLYYGTERVWRKRWNVRDWKLREELTDSNLPQREGWSLGSTGNRSSMRDWQGPVLQTFNMSNDETYASADESWVAVYDEKTFEEKDVLEIPCPGLQQQTMDEDGNVYISTTFNTPVLSLYGVAPASCVVKVKKDGKLDKEWGNKNLADLTGGFDGVNFRYLYDGKAVANVLHHDRLDDVDWEGDIDPAVLVAVEGEWTESGYIPQDTALWDLELIDVEAGTSKTITGWEKGHDVGSYLVNYKVDGRVFFKFQLDTYEDKPTDVIYELNLDTAKVKVVGDALDGTLDGFERIR